MAIIHGKEGNAKWDAEVARQDFTKIQSWSLTTAFDVVETTGMQNSNDWRTWLPGQVNWTATVDALLDSAGLDISLASGSPDGLGDVSAKLELYINWDTGTPQYVALFGSAINIGTTINSEKDGVTSVTYTFQGTGALTYQDAGTIPSY